MNKPLAAVVLLMTWAPLIGVAVLVGVIVGWRIPVAWFAFHAVMLVRLRRRNKQTSGLVRLLEFVLLTVVGATLGGWAAGGLGVIFGSVIGFVARLSEEPITGVA